MNLNIDWTRYPKLAAIFENRPDVNVYSVELRSLLEEINADAQREATERIFAGCSCGRPHQEWCHAL